MMFLAAISQEFVNPVCTAPLEGGRIKSLMHKNSLAMRFQNFIQCRKFKFNVSESKA